MNFHQFSTLLARIRHHALMPLLLASISCIPSFNGWALQVRPMNLDEVIKSSDHIFTAVCESKHSEFHDGNIFTVYKLRLTETWKGKPATQRDGMIRMEELGGSYENPVTKIRLGQYVDGAAALVAGEEVLLFTREHRENPELTAKGIRSPYQAGNLEIVGRIFGRFSIITDADTGSKHVVRPSLEDRGVIPGDASGRTFLNAQQKLLRAKQRAAGATTPTREEVENALKQSAKLGRRGLSKPGLVAEIGNLEELSAVRDRVTGQIKKLAEQQGKAN